MNSQDLADNILKAAGSALRNYTLHGNREKILAVAQEAINQCKPSWKPISSKPKAGTFLVRSKLGEIFEATNKKGALISPDPSGGGYLPLSEGITEWMERP